MGIFEHCEEQDEMVCVGFYIAKLVKKPDWCAVNTKKIIASIIERITTKGGTTEAGMKSLNQEMITETLEECVRKSYEKAQNICE